MEPVVAEVDKEKLKAVQSQIEALNLAKHTQDQRLKMDSTSATAAMQSALGSFYRVALDAQVDTQKAQAAEKERLDAQNNVVATRAQVAQAHAVQGELLSSRQGLGEINTTVQEATGLVSEH